MRLTAAVIAVTMLMPLPARGHNEEEQTEWKQDWVEEAWADRHLSPSELSTYLSFTSKHIEPIVLPAQASPSRPPATSQGASVEQWHSLLATYFQPADLEWARRVMWCESRGDPNAYNTSSGASGLFQHLERFWTDRSAKAGWAGADVFDPEANIAVASWLFYTGGAQHWVCK